MKRQNARVRDAMTSLVYTCETGDSLERAAQLLWEHDCGCLPVVNSEGVVLSMITDRDICMAAYTGGRSLKEMRVGDSMSPSFVACGPDDDLALAAEKMAQDQVRHLPVVDDTGRLRGVLSINDMACSVLRLSFIKSVGQAAETLTDEQRRALTCDLGSSFSEWIEAADEPHKAERSAS